jgi:tRNA pseudouridine55 synthase
MDEVLNIYKPQGMTPLQALDALRVKRPAYRDEKMTYAGRLDPMAEGVLIVLAGSAVHRKEAYLGLDKVYEVTVVFGFGTDTYDILGMSMKYETQDISNEKIEMEVNKMKGIFEYPFPDYSSKPVNGKPLYQWAREARLGEVEVPKRTMQIYGVTLLDMYTITIEEMKDTIEERIAEVKGDFRQKEILSKWGVVFAGMNREKPLLAARIRIDCASGTYVRTLVHELGKRLGSDAVVSRLVRTQVGEHLIDSAMRLR